jgi:hypothetical protein
MSKEWTLWSPAFAVHPETKLPVVAGRHEERDPLDDVPRQAVEADCLVCGEHFQTTCDSGQPRRHIQQFGALHMRLHFSRYRPVS